MSTRQKLKFNKYYLFLTIVLFLIELSIALYIKDNFIRPFGGDVLVVILIYCFLKIFWNERPLKVALIVLAFSFVVEILQYFNVVKLLGLQNNKIASVIIGTSFSWLDLVAYTVGFIIILTIEKWINKKIF